jgi:tRNA threonylcarbamoyladenosine biosynthesis protein TsaB
MHTTLHASFSNARGFRVHPVESTTHVSPAAKPLKILALDTSTEYCSAALWINSALEVREAHAGQTHSAILLRMIDELLRSRAVSLRELDGIAFGAGPGSFTGLRIACGVVQGLAFGAALPVVGVGTLLAMAAGTRAQRVVCCMDARMHEIYHAAYQKEGEAWRAIHEPSVCAPESAPLLEGAGWFGGGSGFGVYRAALETRYSGQLTEVEAATYPHARDIARLSVPRFKSGDIGLAESASPLYVRDKVALRIDERATR